MENAVLCISVLFLFAAEAVAMKSPVRKFFADTPREKL